MLAERSLRGLDRLQAERDLDAWLRLSRWMPDLRAVVLWELVVSGAIPDPWRNPRESRSA